jgi:predicted nucleic acid-binding protein
VSGDRHLLALHTVEGIEVLTARQFLDRLVAMSLQGPQHPE